MALPSLPIPLSFIPPKGATAVLMIPSFTPTKPFCSLHKFINKKERKGIHEQAVNLNADGRDVGNNVA
jgi:hypothetical protein